LKLPAFIVCTPHKSNVSIHVQPANTESVNTVIQFHSFTVFNSLLLANAQFDIKVTVSGITNPVICVLKKLPAPIDFTPHKSRDSIHVQFANTQLSKDCNHSHNFTVFNFLLFWNAPFDIDVTVSGITNPVIWVLMKLAEPID
jgi:hypothetical protein